MNLLNYQKPGASAACDQAQVQGLSCLYQKGTLSHLRRLNRPAILSLIDASGDEFQMVLAALDDEAATLLADGKSYPIAFDDLAEYWYGDHLLVWQPGEGAGTDIAPGTRGDGVVWLRRSLAEIDGEPAPARISDVYDRALEERVRAYQRERRLTVDGIVGAQTQVVINTELGAPGTPVLKEPH